MTDITIDMSGPVTERVAAYAQAAGQSADQAAASAMMASAQAQAAAASVLTLPNVYASMAAGIAGTGIGETFWAQTARGVALFRKTDAANVSLLVTLSNSVSVPLSLVAVPDAKIVEFAAVTSGSATLDARAAIFDVADVGKTIAIAGAGPSGAKLVTTIAAVISPTRITLAVAASTSTSIAGATLGTDCGPAITGVLSAMKAAGGGQLVIDGLFFLHSPVSQTLGDNVAQISMVGRGGDSGLIIATDPTVDAIIFSGGGRILVDGVNFVGTPLEAIDSRRALSFISTYAIMRNCGWFGVACIGAADGAVVYAESSNLATEDNFFGSCVGGLSNPTIMHRGFAGAYSHRDRFFDYGRFQSILFIKTGMSFTKAWIYGENQFGEDQGAAPESTFRVQDSRFDEGHIYAIGVTTDLGSGKRINRVHIEGVQINDTFSTPGSALLMERCDNVAIERVSIGWCNVPHTGLTLNDCGVVLVDGVRISAGAPGTPTGVADEIVATDVQSLICRDSDFARFTFTRVARFDQERQGSGGVLPFQKNGRITDADFPVPPPIGTLGVDLANQRIYARFAAGWLATPVMTASTDPTFVLHNVTPTTGAVTGAGHYAKTSGDQSWSNCTANLPQTLFGGFTLKVSFPNDSAATYTRVGAVPASFGPDAITEVNDLRLGVLQNAGNQIYLAHDGDLIAGPFAYAAGQPVELDYDDQAGTVTLIVNGVVQVNGIAAPANVMPNLEMRFSSTLYSVGAAFDLAAFDPR